MSKKVGRPKGRFNEKKEKLLFLLRNAPELLLASNEKLSEVVGSSESQVRRYLSVLKTEKKIQVVTRTYVYGGQFFSTRVISVTPEEVNAIF